MRSRRYAHVMPTHLAVAEPKYRVLQTHFFTALGIALAVHALGFAGWDWFYEPEEVKTVRVLSLKLSGGGEIFAATPDSTADTASTPATADTPEQSAEQLPSSLPNPTSSDFASAAEAATPPPAEPSMAAPTTATAQPIVEEESVDDWLFPPEPTDHITAQSTDDADIPQDTPAVATLPTPQAPKTVHLRDALRQQSSAKSSGTTTRQTSSPSVASGSGQGVAPWESRRYVRDSLSATNATQMRDAQVIARYEQQLSQWILKHKTYPAYARNNNLSGNVLVRIQINREGRLLNSWLELSSQHPVLDMAAKDMVQRAAPMPAIPPDYPAGERFEFIIPVSFGSTAP